MNKQNRFLPTTKDEMKQRGWDELDVVLITGDAYIDSPFMGIAVVGRILEDISEFDKLSENEQDDILDVVRFIEKLEVEVE